MKTIRIVLSAANEAEPTPDLSSSAAQRPMSAVGGAANARVIEGKLSIPYGLWPVTIVNEDGKQEKVVQRLSKPVADRLIAAFNSLRGRLSRFVGGCHVYMGHPDQAQARDAAAWKRFGAVTGLEASDSALVGIADLPEETKALLAANEQLAPSPFWGLKRTGEKQDGLEICEPVALYSWGLTPRPNIAGAAVNEDAAANAEVQALQDAGARDRELALLAAEIADTETRLQAANSALQARTLEVAARDTSINDLKAQIVTLRSELETARAGLTAAANAQTTAVAAANTARDTAVAAANAQRDAAIAAVVDAAIAGTRLIAKDRDLWLGKLRETPAAANELFSAGFLKTRSIVDPARIAAANADLGGTSAAAKFEAIVRQRMAATKEDWPTAFNACRASHKELFSLMPNGGRA